VVGVKGPSDSIRTPLSLIMMMEIMITLNLNIIIGLIALITMMLEQYRSCGNDSLPYEF
jgi:hypothetical protein